MSNLDPDIEARVRELEAQGVPRGDAIGIAGWEHDHRDVRPPWLAEILNEEEK
jgi:hypothetical protein